MWIEKKLHNFWSQINKSEKVAFLSTFVSGMLIHLFMYANMIPNFDGISRVYEEQQTTVFGRWFLHYLTALHGYMENPMVLGVLSMFFLALAAAMAIRIFEMKNGLISGIFGVVMAAFPAVAYTNGYIYTASAYCMAIFCAEISAWMTKKWKKGFLPAAILFALVMGAYQAYSAVTITLALMIVLRQALSNEQKTKEVFGLGFRYIVSMGLGAAIYYVVLQIFLKVKDLQLLAYLKMDEVQNGYPIGELGSILKNTYKEVIQFFFCTGNPDTFANGMMVVVNILICLGAVFFLVKEILYKKIYKDKLKMAGILAVLLLLPIAANFSQVLSPYSQPTAIMKFALVYFYLFPFMCMDMATEHVEKKSNFVATVLILANVVMCWYYWVYDNTLYTMLNQAHRATQSFVTNVVARVESTEGYQYGMEVVIVGGFPKDRFFAEVESYNQVSSAGAISHSVIPLNKHIYYYMNDWLNVPFKEPAEEVFFEVAADEEFLQMPLYPDDGSVKIINGRVVVKMQETFTPKALFEKQYEMRR